MAVASAASVQEGQPFTVNAAGSSVSTGAALTYAWTQVSGPAVTIANPTSASLSLNAAEVTADTAAQFQVTVTGSGVSSQATANVTFANIAQTPVYNNGSQVVATATFTGTPRRVFGEFNYAVAGIAAAPGDDQAFVDLTSSGAADLQVGGASQLGTLPASARLTVSTALIGAGTERYFGLVEEASDRFRIMTRSTTGQVDTKYSFPYTAPCGFSHAIVNAGTAFYVGTRTGFGVIRANSAPATHLGGVTSGKPYCAVVAPRYTINTGTLNGATAPGVLPASPTFFDVIALDQSANAFDVYVDNGAGVTPSYQLTQTVPVQLNNTHPLQLAAWTEIGQFGGVGFTMGMAMVFTDGVHNGEHRLVIVGFDAAHTLVQQTYNLGLGVPIQVLVDNLDADSGNPEIIVLKSTSPQVEIYEPTGQGAMQNLTGPFFMEVGLGASSAVRSRTLNGLLGMMIAYPDKKQVKIVGATP